MKKCKINCDACGEEVGWAYDAKLSCVAMSWEFDLCKKCMEAGRSTFAALYAKIIGKRKTHT